MAKSFIFNMGYDTSHVTSVLAKEGVENGSNVVLIVPAKDDRRQDNSIDDIANYLKSLDVDVSLETFTAGESFEGDAERFSSLFSRFENIILSLSGGARDLLIPLTVASVFSTEDIQKTYFRSDISSALREIELPKADFQMTENEQIILAKLNDGGKEIKQIVKETDISESTVYRKAGKLGEKGLIRKKDGRYLITPSGRLALDG